MIVVALLIELAKLAGGFLLADIVWGARETKALLFKLFLGTGLGTGLSALFYFLWLWFHLPVHVYPFIEIGLIVVLDVVDLRLRPVINLKERFVSPKPPSKSMLAAALLAAISLAISMAGFLIAALQNPHGVQDAWTIWNVSARFIYGAPERWLAIVPQSVWFHPDYPLLVSLNNAEGWSIMGSDSTRIPIAFAFIFVVSLAGLLYAALAIAKDYAQGLLAVLVIAAAAGSWGLAATQYADVPLSYFFLGTGALLYIYTINHETRLLILAGLFAGFSGWTKNEGLSFMIICLLASILLSIRERKNIVWYFVSGLILPVLVILLFKSVTPPNDLFVNMAQSLQQLLDPSRYVLICSNLVSSLFTFGAWPVSFPLVFALYVVIMWNRSGAPRGQIGLPIFLLLLQFACYFVIYLITPLNLANQLKNSLDRLLFQLFPLALFTLGNLLVSPSEIFLQEVNTQAEPVKPG